jgi:hypothetical protein
VEEQAEEDQAGEETAAAALTEEGAAISIREASLAFTRSSSLLKSYWPISHAASNSLEIVTLQALRGFGLQHARHNMQQFIGQCCISGQTTPLQHLTAGQDAHGCIASIFLRGTYPQVPGAVNYHNICTCVDFQIPMSGVRLRRRSPQWQVRGKPSAAWEPI